ncbi:MAG: Gfo/Idh/MocA family oxidoreductase [Ardenticatenaceae bacterium]|nr:Gfo/Idh/MocA family oxidoreductase [Ardenticatenaceae bacterium]
MTKLGVGIVGAGFAAEVHARAFQELAGLGVELAGVVSRSRARAAAFADRSGVRQVYATYEELLSSPNIDIVDLCVPNDLHHPLALQAAGAGKHVICEKPLTGYFGPGGAHPVGLTSRATMLAEALRQADEMLAAARSNRVRLMYAENWVYAPAIEKARRLIAASKGTIMELRGVEAHSGSHAAYAKSWRESGGGALLRLGAHPIGAAIHLKRYEGLIRDGRPITVQAVTAEVGDLTRIASFQAEPQRRLVDGWEDVENWAVMILTFSDGARGVLMASDIALGGIEAWLQILLSNGRIQCNLARSNVCETYAPDASVWGDEYLAEKLETKAGWSFASVDEHWLLGYPQEMRDFVEAVRNDRPPLSDGELGRAVVEAVYAAYLAAECGERVTLERRP